MTKITITRTALFLYFIAFKDVASWTIDLPEVRKYFFEKSEQNKITNNKNIINGTIKFFDNIKGDSPHNTDKYETNVGYSPGDDDNKDYDNDVYGGKYADDYDYQSYMEKRVSRIVQQGSIYLEGLRKAIERYGQVLQNCTQYNFTATTVNQTTWMPEIDMPPQSQNMSLQQNASTCERATRASEHVRRLAELALWATRELEEKSYDGRFGKHDSEEEKVENELVLRLAWFLDRLAHYTGFEPDPKDFIEQTTTSTTTAPPTPPALMPVPEDVKNTMMNCLNKDSEEPADQRCKYPLPLPNWLMQLLNVTDNPSTPPVQAPQSPGSEASASSFDEILMPAETKLSNLPPSVTAVKSVKKRSIDDNPLLHVMKYYAKHKAWVNSNPNSEPTKNSEELLNNNAIPIVNRKRRSINKKSKIHIPENPMQDISQYVKHKSGVRYTRDEIQMEKIKHYLDKVRHSDSLTAKNNVRKLEKTYKSVQKRSINYEKKKPPKISENPMQDISYYIKNKPGTNYNPDVAQIAQIRGNLEGIYQTGNIEVIRRYGANYNPANPNVVMTGAMASYFGDV